MTTAKRILLVALAAIFVFANIDLLIHQINRLVEEGPVWTEAAIMLMGTMIVLLGLIFLKGFKLGSVFSPGVYLILIGSVVISAAQQPGLNSPLTRFFLGVYSLIIAIGVSGFAEKEVEESV